MINFTGSLSNSDAVRSVQRQPNFPSLPGRLGMIATTSARWSIGDFSNQKGTGAEMRPANVSVIATDVLVTIPEVFANVTSAQSPRF